MKVSSRYQNFLLEQHFLKLKYAKIQSKNFLCQRLGKNNNLIDLDSIKGTQTEKTYISDPNNEQNLIDQKCVKTTLNKHLDFIFSFLATSSIDFRSVLYTVMLISLYSLDFKISIKCKFMFSSQLSVHLTTQPPTTFRFHFANKASFRSDKGNSCET